MARKDRLDGQPFTCSNTRFETRTDKGEPHGPGNATGSVFGEAIIPGDGYTLWLEHVRDKSGGSDMFWMMWYDPEGTPTIPMSGVFSKDQLREMVSRLARFVEV